MVDNLPVYGASELEPIAPDDPQNDTTFVGTMVVGVTADEPGTTLYAGSPDLAANVDGGGAPAIAATAGYRAVFGMSAATANGSQSAGSESYSLGGVTQTARFGLDGDSIAAADQGESSSPLVVSNDATSRGRGNPTVSIIADYTGLSSSQSQTRAGKLTAADTFTDATATKPLLASLNGAAGVAVSSVPSNAGDPLQLFASSTIVDGAFRSLGPSPATGPVGTIGSGDNPPNGSITGAIQAIVVDPADSNTMWIGGVNGGVWVTHNKGATWTPLTDKQASLSIASIALDPTDATHNTLIAGIGLTSNGTVGSFSTSHSFFLGNGGQRTGILLSTDGGTTWSALGGATLANHSIVGVAARGSTLLAAAFEEWAFNSGDATEQASGGLYRSTDGGATFTQVAPASGLPTDPVTSLVGDPANNAVLYAAVTSGANHSATAVYVSTDTGATWTPVFGAAQSGGKISAGGNQTIARIAIGPGGQIAVGLVNYNASTNSGVLSGLFLSSNSGSTWTSLAVPTINNGGQGVVNFAIAIDPTSPGVVYVSGDRIAGSPFTAAVYRVTTSGAVSMTDAGNTSNGSTIHPDTRTIAFDSSGNLILGTDGGIYARSSPTTSTGAWTGLNGSGLAVGAPYSLAFDGNSDRLAVAAQDTGVDFENSPGGQVFTAINGGDGTNATINDVTAGTTSALYDSSQFLGGLQRLGINSSGVTVTTKTVNFSNKDGFYLPGFSSPVVLNSIDPSLIALGAGNVYVTQDTLSDINTVSSSVTLSLTDVGGSGTTNGFAFYNVVYGTQDNTYALLGSGFYGLFRSTAAAPGTGAGTLTAVSAYNAMMSASTALMPTGLAFDLRAQARFFVADSVNLFYTTNSGSSFTTITSNLTGIGIVRANSVEFISNDGVNALLVGGLDNAANMASPIAAADSDSAGVLSNWRLFGTGLPNTIVNTMNYDVKADTLAVGAFGRGSWVLYDVTSNFASATTLQFGLANNDSTPDATLLTGVRPLVKYGSGTLTITGVAGYSGGSTINAGIMQIGSGVTTGSVSGTIAFGSTTGELGLANDAGFGNTISGLNVGTGGARTTSIDIEGHTVSVAGTAGHGTNSGTITLSDSVVLQLTNLTSTNWFADTAPDGSGGTFVYVSDTAVCFCRGTLILTDRGEVPVEQLAVGDRVETLSGIAKPIVWIGMGRDLVTAANKLARPVIVRRGALGENVPRRDLYLTHGHALYLDGVLIPVENLINHHSILWDEAARVVEYYHIELEDHDVVFAEGAMAESYYDAGNRALFHNTRPGSEAGAAMPTFAPVLNGGDVVDKVWAALFERAGGQIECNTTDDHDLHLVADGERLDPVSVEGCAYTFTVERPPTATLRLCSRSGVPSLLDITRHDHRWLGVAISRIELRQAGIVTSFEPGAPLFAQGGCHVPEGGFCWTDGEFDLPARLFAHLTGTFSLTVHTERPGMRYPILAALAQAA